jgi:hypothetical protein
MWFVSTVIVNFIKCKLGAIKREEKQEKGEEIKRQKALLKLSCFSPFWEGNRRLYVVLCHS